ncbi:MAG TPA: copper-binding protein [Phenylobacterium sp.]|nr:copper-binding protein [Phenylobacterium sp.]
MRKRRLLPVLFALMAATAASAQPGGGGHGHGGGGGGGGSGGGGGGSSGGPAPSAPRRAQTPVNQLQIVGVVKAIDAAAGRITIAYEPVEALNWPSGTQPFPVAKSALLNGVTVDEKVRFTLDSGEIATLKPF